MTTKKDMDKNKVVIEFANEKQAAAFYSAFSEPEKHRRTGIDIILDCIPSIIDVDGVSTTKIRKTDFYIKVI